MLKRIVTGYGACLRPVSHKEPFIENGKEKFFRTFAMQSEWIAGRYRDFALARVENEFDLIRLFIKWYYNPDNDKRYGIGGLLVDTINELEFDGENVFTIHDGCIFVPAYIPENQNEVGAKRYPTRERIRELFAEYIEPFLTDKLSIGWISADLDAWNGM